MLKPWRIAIEKSCCAMVEKITPVVNAEPGKGLGQRLSRMAGVHGCCGFKEGSALVGEKPSGIVACGNGALDLREEMREFRRFVGDQDAQGKSEKAGRGGGV